ncbi:MAG: FAD-dependent oxidoreductase [Pseudomonadota bacterium]
MAGIVVVGAGQAGASVVAKLRALDYAGQITLIGEEPQPPYQRPPLSKKYLLGELELERMYLRPESFYPENDIDLCVNEQVTSIVPGEKEITTTDRTIQYDHLVLATGSVPRRLPAAMGGDLDGVYLVRGLSDVDAMAPEFREGAHVLIVGGGYIGLEAAAVAAKKGLKVTLIEMADRILKRVASPETSDFFRDLHAVHGVDIRESTGLERLVGDTRVTRAELAGGETLDVDFVIVGVGIDPATDLAAMAKLEIDNGIKTDEFCRTSDPHIWAAGDCASFPYRGDRVRLESVPNAHDMAECVAENIMGAEKAYIAQPWFWSDQYDIKLQIAGLNTGYNRVVSRPDGKGKGMSFWYFKDDELLAVDAASEPRAYMVGKRLIDAGKSPAPDQIADTGLELKTLLKA